MRLVVVLHRDKSTSLALAEAAHLAQALQPDMTLVGVAAPGGSQREWLEILRESRRELLREMGGAIVYPADETCYKLVRPRAGLWEERPETTNGHRELILKLRVGLPGRQVLAELAEGGADLVLVGANGHEQLWEPGYRIGMKLVRKGGAAVMVVKGGLRWPGQIVWCVGSTSFSAQVKNLIKTLVELYKVGLDVVGIGDAGQLRAKLKEDFGELWSWYASRSLPLWVEELPTAMVEDFLKEQVRRGIVILDMSRHSPFSRIVSPRFLNELLHKAKAPVVILP